MRRCHKPYHITGIAVGNGFTDPITILDYSHFVYQLGLVDTYTYNEMKDAEESGKRAIREGRLVDAFLVRTTVPTLPSNVGASMSVMFLCIPHYSLRIYPPSVANSADLFEA
jgi:hypothetical protein